MALIWINIEEHLRVQTGHASTTIMPVKAGHTGPIIRARPYISYNL